MKERTVHSSLSDKLGSVLLPCNLVGRLSAMSEALLSLL